MALGQLDRCARVRLLWHWLNIEQCMKHTHLENGEKPQVPSELFFGEKA